MSGIIGGTGNKSGIIRRVLSGTNCYHGYNGNQNSTSPTWRLTPSEGTGVGFFRNDDNFLTHSDNTASFVCNIAGAYGVSASVIPYSSASSIHCQIRKNGTNHTDIRGPVSSGHGSAGGMIILECVATDTITVVTENVNAHSGGYSFISIFWLGVK